MGNPQHLEWLLEGVEAWNTRRDAGDFTPDFAQTEIRAALVAAWKLPETARVDLSSINLRGADLQRANLRGANLRRADLWETNLRDAKLWQANLREANLRGADLREADLWGADLRGANLWGADLRGANLQGADLQEANLREANLQRANLREADVQTIVYSAVRTIDGSTAEYTDLSTTHFLTPDQLNVMTGDSGTILPPGLDRPEHWPDWEDQPPVPDPKEADLTPPLVAADLPTPADARRRPNDPTQTILTSLAPAFDVYWDKAQLTTDLVLSAKDPVPQRFHPRRTKTAEVDALSSLGQMAAQISNALAQDDRINARSLVGSLSGLFDAVAAEVTKPDGLVLSFVVETNLNALEILYKDHAEALREVDGALIQAFLQLGKTWRDGSYVVQEYTDPGQSEIVPAEKLDAIEAKQDEMVALITDPAHADKVSPALAGVTREMSTYPWDKDDQTRHRRKRAAAFGAVAHRIWIALSNPPDNVIRTGGFYATLLGTVAAIIALFAGT